MTPIKIIVTEDGSQSLYNSDLRETYHSTHGAITESDHVFIKHGVDYLKNLGDNDHIDILEVGFGTGLNALLTQGYTASFKGISIDYVTLEPFPLDESVINKLEYHKLLSDKVSGNDFIKLHNCSWAEKHQLNAMFAFTKYQDTLQDFRSNVSFDLVFYDAFAPNKQADMWTYETLEHLTAMMSAGAVLVTYCARGQFKRDLSALGMSVETLPGPPGKKEMVRATLL